MCFLHKKNSKSNFPALCCNSYDYPGSIGVMLFGYGYMLLLEPFGLQLILLRMIFVSGSAGVRIRFGSIVCEQDPIKNRRKPEDAPIQTPKRLVKWSN